MTITWYGHSCFRIEAKEGSILTDPFSKSIGLRPPKIKDDVVLVSHDHDDHVGGLDDPNPEALIVRGPGEYEKQGIAIRGITSFHDKSEGTQRGPNTIYVIRAEDLTMCHLGDVGQAELTDHQVEEIGDVDVLFVPVGGTYTLDAKEAAHVIGQIEPKIVVPMHYKVKDLQLDIDGPEKFVKELGISAEKVEKLKVAKKTLPTEEMKLVVFDF